MLKMTVEHVQVVDLSNRKVNVIVSYNIPDTIDVDNCKEVLQNTLSLDDEYDAHFYTTKYFKPDVARYTTQKLRVELENVHAIKVLSITTQIRDVLNGIVEEAESVVSKVF